MDELLSTRLDFTFTPDERELLLMALAFCDPLAFEEKFLIDECKERFSFFFVQEHEAEAYRDQVVEALNRTGSEHQIVVSIQPVERTDWSTAWKEGITSAAIGERLFIRPTWLDDECPEGRQLIVLDPGLAFGTGSHETTTLCLEALERIAQHQGLDRVLDVGTGSGILSIAASKLGASHVFGIDIDAPSIDTARENADLNNVAGVEFAYKELDTVGQPYQVVLANIISGVLLTLFERLWQNVQSPGVLLLSGVLVDELDQFIPQLPVSPTAVVAGEEWALLEFRR